MVLNKRKIPKDLVNPSLYTCLKKGERVKRKHIDKSGNIIKYEGIILAIDSDSIHIFWDTCNGKYSPYNLEGNYSKCTIDEIFRGYDEYSPILKNRRYL